ncbi:MAG: ABC transporter permease, partial [Rhodospirillales bacterium]|nr:ABC transporter permease [Rhodospirillales bacterium]
LSPAELTLAIAAGGVSRGLLVGLAVSLSMLPFVTVHMHAPVFILFHAVMASLMLSLLGMIGGIWADKFDHMAAVTNFIVTPLSFLSGTFYSIESLPQAFRVLALANPFFYMIDGFRHGFIGHADGSLLAGAVTVTLFDALLGWVAFLMFRTGYKLKA